MVVDEKQTQPPAATTIIYERTVLSIAVVMERLDRGSGIPLEHLSVLVTEQAWFLYA